MTILTEISEDTYVADGTLNPRDIGFAVPEPGALYVEIDGAIQTYGIHYTITGDYLAGKGSIQPLAPFAADGKVHYYRVTRLRQEAELPAGRPLPSRRIEQQLDRDVMRVQELGGEVARSVRVKRGEAAFTLPSIGERAGKILAFSGMGAPAVITPDFNAVPINDFGAWNPEAPLNGEGDRPEYFSTDRLNMRKAGFIDSSTMDQSATMEQLAAYVNATPHGCVIDWPDMRVNVSRDMHFNKPVRFVGALPTCSKLLCRNDAQMKFYGLRTPYASTMFALENIWVATEGLHSSFPISVEFQDGYLLPDASLAPTLMLRDMLISGRNRESGFKGAIDLLNVPWPRLHNVAIIGDQEDKTSEYGIRYRGKHGSLWASGLRAYFVENGLDAEGEMEGIIVDGQSEMVAVRNGINYRDNTAGLQPYFVVSNTHLNAEKCCVRLEGVDAFNVGQGCLFYGQPFDGTEPVWTAVDIYASTTGSAIVNSGTVADLVIAGDGQAPGKTRYGVRVNGGASYEDFLIDNVRFQGLDIGVKLEAGTNGVRVTDACTHRNVVVPVENLGTGKNFVKGLGYRYPFARLPDATEYPGERLFVIDSSVNTFGAPVAAGGGGQVPVYSDGTIWRVG